MRPDTREVGVGAPAPDVTLTAPNGQAVRLHDYRGRNHLVLYFMRSFGSAQCQEHLRQLGLGYRAVSKLGAEIIAIGPGSTSELLDVTRRLRLPYPVLSDGAGVAYRAFGLDRVMIGMVQTSGTVVVDREGVIRYLMKAANPTRAFDGRALLGALRAASRDDPVGGSGSGANDAGGGSARSGSLMLPPERLWELYQDAGTMLQEARERAARLEAENRILQRELERARSERERLLEELLSRGQRRRLRKRARREAASGLDAE